MDEENNPETNQVEIMRFWKEKDKEAARLPVTAEQLAARRNWNSLVALIKQRRRIRLTDKQWFWFIVYYLISAGVFAMFVALQFNSQNVCGKGSAKFTPAASPSPESDSCSANITRSVGIGFGAATILSGFVLLLVVKGKLKPSPTLRHVKILLSFLLNIIPSYYYQNHPNQKEGITIASIILGGSLMLSSLMGFVFQEGFTEKMEAITMVAEAITLYMISVNLSNSIGMILVLIVYGGSWIIGLLYLSSEWKVGV